MGKIKLQFNLTVIQMVDCSCRKRQIITGLNNDLVKFNSDTGWSKKRHPSSVGCLLFWTTLYIQQSEVKT